MHQPPRLYIDFDGTISAADTTDMILESFALPEWQVAEAAWERGEIGSRECMAQQVSCLRVTPAELARMAADIPVDPGFAGFIDLCRRWNMPFTILSDGLDVVARMVLDRLGITAPILSNRMESLGGDRWQLAFPYADAKCLTRAGNCKCASLEAEQRRGAPAILIGDGRSDFCGAGAADQVFAKGRLATYCRDNRIAHVPFDNFTELTDLFRTGLPLRRPMVAAE